MSLLHRFLQILYSSSLMVLEFGKCFLSFVDILAFFRVALFDVLGILYSSILDTAIATIVSQYNRYYDCIYTVYRVQG